MKHSTIFVAYDKLENNTICAAPTMDAAITQALKYMAINEYTCNGFCYNEILTIINFEQDYRFGSRVEHVENLIAIIATDFIQPDE